ncbi:unnamed protein product [Hapterophycus canaliculatus]
MAKNYANQVLKYVPRVVPQPDVLVQRYDLVIDAFTDVRDAKTGNALFTDRLKKSITDLRVHLQAGCLSGSDPRDVQLYFWAGRTADGIDKFRCARGTMNGENYHKFVRGMLAGTGTSPRMAHSVLLPFNYRRNHRMAGE